MEGGGGVIDCRKDVVRTSPSCLCCDRGEGGRKKDDVKKPPLFRSQTKGQLCGNDGSFCERIKISPGVKHRYGTNPNQRHCTLNFTDTVINL